MSYPEPDPASGSGPDSGGIGSADDHLVLAAAVLPAVEQLAIANANGGTAGHDARRPADPYRAVTAAADHGATYADLAVALGISEEAARSRWSGAIATSAAFKVAR